MSELNSDARRLVNLARQARTPGADDKLRIAQRLAVPLAASAAVGTAVGTAKAAAGVELAGAKAAGGALLGGLLSSVGAKIAAVVAVGAVGTAVVVSQLGPGQGAAPAPQRAAASTPRVLPAEPGPEIAVRDPASAESPAEPEPKLVEPKPAQRPSASPAGELAQEAALLHQAQSAWRAGQSAKALELANQHAARFPHSQLANERDVLRVLSLCKLGQVHAAKQVGARLLRTAKGSPWYQSVAESCAAD